MMDDSPEKETRVEVKELWFGNKAAIREIPRIH
jgi:hypothetical protein